MLSRSLRVLGALTGSLAGCALATRQAHVPVPRADAQLTVWPRLALMSPAASGVRVLVTLRVHRPTPEMRCAAELWEWGDGETSGHSEDCRPEDLAPWPNGVPMVLTQEHIYRRSGIYAVAVLLVNSRGIQLRSEAQLQLLRAGEGIEP